GQRADERGGRFLLLRPARIAHDRRVVAEPQRERPDPDLVAVLDGHVADGLAVDPHAVGRFVVPDGPGLVLADGNRVLARDREVVQNDVVVRRAPDRDLLLQERIDLRAAVDLVEELDHFREFYRGAVPAFDPEIGT